MVGCQNPMLLLALVVDFRAVTKGIQVLLSTPSQDPTGSKWPGADGGSGSSADVGS